MLRVRPGRVEPGEPAHHEAGKWPDARLAPHHLRRIDAAICHAALPGLIDAAAILGDRRAQDHHCDGLSSIELLDKAAGRSSVLQAGLSQAFVEQKAVRRECRCLRPPPVAPPGALQVAETARHTLARMTALCEHLANLRAHPWRRCVFQLLPRNPVQAQPSRLAMLEAHLLAHREGRHERP